MRSALIQGDLQSLHLLAIYAVVYFMETPVVSWGLCIFKGYNRSDLPDNQACKVWGSKPRALMTIFQLNILTYHTSGVRLMHALPSVPQSPAFQRKATAQTFPQLSQQIWKLIKNNVSWVMRCLPPSATSQRFTIDLTNSWLFITLYLCFMEGFFCKWSNIFFWWELA